MVPDPTSDVVPDSDRKDEKRLRLDSEDRFVLLRAIDKILQTKISNDDRYYGTRDRLRGLAERLYRGERVPRRKYWLPKDEEIHRWVLDGLAARRKHDKEVNG